VTCLLGIACAGSSPEPAGTAPPPEAATENEALAADPHGVDDLVGLAEAQQRRGQLDASRRTLVLALERDPSRYDVHARLAELTGPAPRSPSASGTAAIDLAEAHPYDPWALLRAGEALMRSGAHTAAIETLERVVWMGDIDPSIAAEAVDWLVALSERWRDRRVVPVHLFADEPIRAEKGWEFRLRTVLLAVSNSLSSALQVRFVPVSIGEFRSGGIPPDLESIHGAFTRATASPPGGGVLAAFTGRPLPRHGPDAKKGIAEFLGRRLTVRLDPRAVQSRALAHEILHLYGAMHVADDLDSLMNPAGDSLTLDPLSHRVVRATRWRTFESGRFERDVLPWIDLRETIDAYVAVLGANLTFRQMGIAGIVEQQSGSHPSSAAQAGRVTVPDPHLADVSRIVAVLMLSDGRRVEALSLLETAAELYGRGTKRGRETAEHAEALRQSLLEQSGQPTGPPTDRRPGIR
jgi:tetratricopeptide (TPR) repeat protein